jgi:hypothetical protein
MIRIHAVQGSRSMSGLIAFALRLRALFVLASVCTENQILQ